MGHYDSCYDTDAKEEAKRNRKETEDLFDLMISKLNHDEKKFLIKVMRKINEWQTFFKLFNL